jgi:hypothetical protein
MNKMLIQSCIGRKENRMEYAAKKINGSKKYRLAVALLFILCVLPRVGEAATLVLYDFSAATFVTSDTDTNSSAGNFTFASGLSANSGRSTTAPNANTIFTRGTSLGTTAAGAVSGNDYYTFTLSPSAGYQMNLNNLTFSTDATLASGTNSFTGNIFVRSDLDGYTSDIGPTITDTGSTVSSYVLQNIDLSGAAFQGLTTAITFRIYLYNTGTNAGDTNSIIRSDTYTLDGVMVAVPEPSSYALLGLGLGLGLGAFYLMRRRQANQVDVAP